MAGLGVCVRVSERGNRSGSKRWTWVSHFHSCTGDSSQCAVFVLSPIAVIANKLARSNKVVLMAILLL